MRIPMMRKGTMRSYLWKKANDTDTASREPDLCVVPLIVLKFFSRYGTNLYVYGIPFWVSLSSENAGIVLELDDKEEDDVEEDYDEEDDGDAL